VGRRARKRDAVAAPASQYTDEDGNRLRLRGSLTPRTRLEYAAILGGERLTAAGAREDAWQRAVEFLFERLAVGWDIAGVPLSGQRELLARLRVATPAERAFVRTALRAHCAEHFPDVEAP
jgi:hypothetical protein